VHLPGNFTATCDRGEVRRWGDEEREVLTGDSGVPGCKNCYDGGDSLGEGPAQVEKVEGSQA
jgi:hypothetical protein